MKKTKRIFRLLCVLIFTLVLFQGGTIYASANFQYPDDITSDRDMEWARVADIQEVKSELKDLQKYMLPLDEKDKYVYEVLNLRGGGSNQVNADDYVSRLSYTIKTYIKHEGILYPLTCTRVDLKLPELPKFRGHDEHVFYYVSVYDTDSFDDINFTENENRTNVTSVGSYPAKGSYITSMGKYSNYQLDVYVNLNDLLPWASGDPKNCAVLNLHIQSAGKDAWDLAKDVEKGMLAWQPEISEPVVIAAETDPEILKMLGKKPSKTDVVVDTPAKDEAGEDKGTEIPAAIVIGALGTLGAGAALAGAAIANGSDNGGEDKKKQSTFKMYINKDFGSDLKKGDRPQPVYARIAETKPDGSEVDRPDLTQRIQVYSSDNSLDVSDGGMKNSYRCAMVRVYDEAEPPPEGKVSFYFEGEGGTFTQNVIFNIAVPGIKFFQDNLTLPAGALDEPEFLPFEISDMGDEYEVEVEYTGDEYEVDLTDAADKEAKNIRFAVFMEKDKQPIEAGVYVEHWLNVTVRNEMQELKASLKIIRMGLGLNISAKAINCYRVPKPESAGKAMKDMKPADFDTSVTETQGYLITYDAENHQVLQQPAFPTVTFAPLENEEPEKKKQIAEALSRLDIQLKIKDVEDNFSNCVIFCKGGFLDAPTRYFVKMTLSYTVGETTYTKEKEVLLRSQACRLVAGVRENYEVDKFDDQITENLNTIKAIVFDYYYNQLFPLYNMIDRMTYGYDRAYGYDPYQVAKVFDVWERFQTGEMLGANAEAYKYGIADELEALAAASRSWDGFQGIVLRLSLDIMTGGASEVVMVALDVNRAAMDYRKETGGNGTAYGYFKAMALPIAFAVVPGGVAKYGKKITGTVGKVANYIAPNKTAALMNKINKVKGVAKEMKLRLAL